MNKLRNSILLFFCWFACLLNFKSLRLVVHDDDDDDDDDHHHHQ